jgi:hypothetical protein
VEILDHSVRDAASDDEFLSMMKAGRVAYIPTLSLDDFAFAYREMPPWFHDPFFRAALEPGVLAMMSSPSYREAVRSDPKTPREMAALAVAQKNLKRSTTLGSSWPWGVIPVRPRFARSASPNTWSCG